MTKTQIYQKLKVGDLFLVVNRYNPKFKNYYLVTAVSGKGGYKEVYTKLYNNKGLHRFTYTSIAFEERSTLFSVKLITNPKEKEVIKTLYFTNEEL
jgi:hypothetical protein